MTFMRVILAKRPGEALPGVPETRIPRIMQDAPDPSNPGPATGSLARWRLPSAHLRPRLGHLSRRHPGPLRPVLTLRSVTKLASSGEANLRLNLSKPLQRSNLRDSHSGSFRA